MAYTSGTLSAWSGGPIEGARHMWSYETADSLSTVKGSAYFSDGVERGMQIGDIVFIINTTTPLFAIYFVTATSGNTATVGGTAGTF